MPAAGVGFAMALAIGLMGLSALDRLCPPAQRFEGLCFADWYLDVFQGLLRLCAAIAAFLVVALPAWAAPSHRQSVAWLAYLVGAAFTVHYALRSVEVSLVGAPACALASGLMAVWWVRQQSSRPAP